MAGCRILVEVHLWVVREIDYRTEQSVHRPDGKHIHFKVFGSQFVKGVHLAKLVLA